MKKSLIVLSLIAVFLMFYPTAGAQALLTSFCFNDRIIYAQDIPGLTPGNNSDTAIVNDRNENRIITIPQQNDRKVVFPFNIDVQVFAGDTLFYQGYGDRPALSFDIFALSGATLVNHVAYTNKGFAAETITQNGFLRFSAGTVARQHNLLVLCPGSSSNPTPNPTPGNQAPAWSVVPNQTATVGQLLQIGVMATDSDFDPLTYSAFNLPPGASFDSFTRIFSWTPFAGQSGIYTVVFRVSDGSHTVDMNVSISVSGSSQNNQAPVWSQVGHQTVGGGETLRFSVFASDADGDFLNYSAFNLPSGAFFDSFGRVFTWTPANYQQGTYNVTFRVTDGPHTVDMNVVITVSGSVTNPYFNYYPFNGYQPQWLQTPPQSVVQGQTLQFAVVASDPDFNSLSYSAFSLPSGAAFNSFTRIFTWTPSSNQLGTYTVVFRVSDGVFTSDMNVPITVLGSGSSGTVYQPGQAPAIVNFNPPGVAREGQLYTYTVQATGSSPITYRVINGPQGLIINPSVGVILWVPNFTQGRGELYAVTIGAANSYGEATRSFSITVQDMPQVSAAPPVAPPAPVLSPAPRSERAEPLAISNIAVSRENGEVVISWKTNKLAVSRVIYGTKSEASKTKNFTYASATDYTEESQTEHTIRLKDLETDKTYYFRAVSKANGETLVSNEMNFTYLGEVAAGLGLASASLGALLINPWLYLLLIAAVIGWLIWKRLAKKRMAI